VIRPATPEDRAALRAIQEAALAHPSPDLLAAGLAGPPLLVVSEGADGLVGYVLAVLADEEAYLAELAVAPAHQREGHGSALLAAALDACRDRGVERLRLTARADAAGARAFYREHGFTVVEELPEFYADGDAVAMARPPD
jgi:ribosomal-protein-alanine N-acetyltransferase